MQDKDSSSLDSDSHQLQVSLPVTRAAFGVPEACGGPAHEDGRKVRKPNSSQIFPGLKETCLSIHQSSLLAGERARAPGPSKDGHVFTAGSGTRAAPHPESPHPEILSCYFEPSDLGVEHHNCHSFRSDFVPMASSIQAKLANLMLRSQCQLHPSTPDQQNPLTLLDPPLPEGSQVTSIRQITPRRSGPARLSKTIPFRLLRRTANRTAKANKVWRLRPRPFKIEPTQKPLEFPPPGLPALAPTGVQMGLVAGLEGLSLDKGRGRACTQVSRRSGQPPVLVRKSGQRLPPLTLDKVDFCNWNK